jgi:hypothetical protein
VKPWKYPRAKNCPLYSIQSLGMSAQKSSSSLVGVLRMIFEMMKTPYRHTLPVPSPVLTLLIINEFNRQDKYRRQGDVHLVALQVGSGGRYGH